MPLQPVGEEAGADLVFGFLCHGDGGAQIGGQSFVRCDQGDHHRIGGLRRRGFVSAMQRHGLDAGRLFPIGGPSSVGTGAAAMQRILEEAPDTEAVMCVSDLAAFGALTECQRRGIAVPADLAIAGFGAYEIGEICVPPITTVDPDCYEIGSLAAQVVLTSLSQDALEAGSPVVRISPKLIARASTQG